MKLSITYRAEYRYEKPVSLSPQVIRLFPRDMLHARVESFRFATLPTPSSALAQDRRHGMIHNMKWLLPRIVAPALAIACSGTTPPAHAQSPDPAPLLATLRSVGPEGEGNEAAAAAWKELSTGPATTLPVVLNALDGAKPLAQNWLRAAAGAIADRARAAGQPLPLDALDTLLRDPKHAPATRSLAWDLIRSADAARADALIMTFLEDPAAELRRPGVTRLLDQAAQLAQDGRKDEAATTAENAFRAARDDDQITQAVEQLKELGRAPDVPAQLGLLLDWHLIAPFSNARRGGFDTVYPPEEKIDLAARYPLPDGTQAAWQAFRSTDPFGHVDFNKPFGLIKEVVGYATTTFEAPEARDAELRLGTGNAWKVWLNGKFLFGRDEYHRGSRLDQYTLPIRLEKGSNTLLVKLAQNEQTETWTVDWRFQLRLCDRTGTALTAAAR